ncbi:MAG: hypothetical protein ACJAYE_000873 [Candidatus Azotimanducaceae bacterium]|jgi:hypothetical protein
MSLRIGRAIARDRKGTLIEFDSGCDGCNGCSQGGQQQLLIPGEFEREVVVRLSSRNQLFALFNSLLLPIFVSVCAALVADWFLLGDLYGTFLTVGGFIIGMALCRQLNPSALSVQENI